MRFFALATIICILAAGCAGETVPDSVQKAQEAFKLVQEGDLAAQDNQLDTAIEKYEAALKLVPNAPKFRFAYAQLLYWKALSFDQEWHHSMMQTFGKKFDFAINKWVDMPSTPEGDDKAKLERRSAESKRESLIYFNKALHQLALVDSEWNYAVEAVPFAMGIIYFLTDEYDKSIDSFKRVVASSRISEDYRAKIEKAIEDLEQAKKESEDRKREEKPFLPKDG